MYLIGGGWEACAPRQHPFSWVVILVARLLVQATSCLVWGHQMRVLIPRRDHQPLFLEQKEMMRSFILTN